MNPKMLKSEDDEYDLEENFRTAFKSKVTHHI